MKPELLLFHLNGAVIDIRLTIDTAVRRTVQFYLASFLDIGGAGPIVSDADVEAFRHAGGFSTPWELSAALLRYIFTQLHGAEYAGSPPRNPGEAVAVLKKRVRTVKEVSWEALRERLDFERAAGQIREGGGGVEGAAAAFGGWEHPLLMAEGEIEDGNLVRHLFQEIYLGRSLFGAMEKTHARFYRGAGIYENERVLPGRSTMERLRRHYRGRMAAITEWPRAMADLSLNHLDLAPVFDVLLTAEDVTGEEARRRRRDAPERLSIPHPYLLLEAADQMDPGGRRPALYLGSTPDDMRAARAAGEVGERPFMGWAILAASGERERIIARLRDAGASEIIEEPEQLLKLLLEE